MAHHHHHSHIDCIRLVPIFNHLNEEQMSLIAQSAQEVIMQRMRCYLEMVIKMTHFIL